MKSTKRVFVFTVIIVFAMQVFSKENKSQLMMQSPSVESSYRDFRLSIGGGYAYRLGEVIKTGDKVIDDMSNDLRNGFVIEGDLQYYFKKSWGLGLEVNYVQNSTSANGVYIPADNRTYNLYEENQQVLFIGPAFCLRKDLENFLFTMNVGLGPLFFTDKMTFDGVVLKGTQTTFGMSLDVAGEYKLKNKMGIGLKLSYVIGSIDSMNVRGQKVELDEMMSISSVNIGAFISFRSW